MAEAIRARVRGDLGLPCAVGVARTKLLAKLASRAAKPTPRPDGVRSGTGVFVVDPDAEDAFLLPLPVRAIWGIGPATAARLAQIGVRTVADLRAIPLPSLVRLVGPANGAQLSALAHGEDDRPVEADRAAKSIGHEETFAADLHSHRDLHPHLVRMADAVGARLVESGLSARTVTVKVRYADLSIVTRSHTVPSLNARSISEIAHALLVKVDVSAGVRLLGVAVSNLADAPPARQLTFDTADTSSTDADDEEPTPTRADDAAWRDLDEVMGVIRSRFGHGALAPARLAGEGQVDVEAPGGTASGVRPVNNAVGAAPPLGPGGRALAV